jgi:GTP-binding protein
MRPRTARFVTSAADPTQFPAPSSPEIAFAGRSNVGKSSLINALVGKDGLARTSRTPGRTRLINWFEVDANNTTLAFVDLPGYGYAEVSREMRDSWRPLIETYLTGRDVLRAVVLILDPRRGATDEELDFAAWLDQHGVPLIVVLTKTDKLSKHQRPTAAATVRRQLGLTRDPLLVSAQTGDGLDAVWKMILATTVAPPPPPVPDEPVS